MKRFVYTVITVGVAMGLCAQETLQEAGSTPESARASLEAPAPVAGAAATDPETPRTGPVIVIPVHGQIERGLLSALRRGIRDAERAGARAVVIDMDTPGGQLNAAEEIMRALMRLDIPTYTYVNPDAISAGALIASATDHIYMAPGGRIGDAMPILMSPMPTGGAEAPSDNLRPKIMSPTLAMARAAAQHTNRDPNLFIAMIDPDFEYVVDGAVLCPTGQLLTLTSDEAARLVGEEQRPLLSEGTFNSLAALMDHLEFTHAETRDFGVSAAEQIARYIDSFPINQLLLALGILGVFVEVRTPGFGIPGIAGALCLGLWMWGHHIAGLAGMGEILLLMLGIALLALEVFVIPGFGITGVAGILCILVALVMAMVPASTVEGVPFQDSWPHVQRALVSLTGTFVIAVILAVIAGRFLPETRAFQRLTLESQLPSAVAAEKSESDPLVGQRGEALTELRPSGVARIDGRRLDVVTRGVFIAKGAPVRVSEHHGNRIIVDAAPDAAPADPAAKGLS